MKKINVLFAVAAKNTVPQIRFEKTKQNSTYFQASILSTARNLYSPDSLSINLPVVIIASQFQPSSQARKTARAEPAPPGNPNTRRLLKVILDIGVLRIRGECRLSKCFDALATDYIFAFPTGMAGRRAVLEQGGLAR